MEMAIKLTDSIDLGPTLRRITREFWGFISRAEVYCLRLNFKISKLLPNHFKVRDNAGPWTSYNITALAVPKFIRELGRVSNFN